MCDCRSSVRIHAAPRSAIACVATGVRCSACKRVGRSERSSCRRLTACSPSRKSGWNQSGKWLGPEMTADPERSLAASEACSARASNVCRRADPVLTRPLACHLRDKVQPGFGSRSRLEAAAIHFQLILVAREVGKRQRRLLVERQPRIRCLAMLERSDRGEPSVDR
eukprot:1769745-Prymnesium_polylepis.1